MSVRTSESVTECGKVLGARADTYSTAYAADDTASVLDALDIEQIDLYGDSYGTFFAQVFALRHPERVQTLTLDASYPVSGQDPWWRDTNRAIQDALTRVCSRDPRCAALKGSPVDRMRATAAQLSTNPIVAKAFNAEGKQRTVRLDGVNLALATAYATYGTNIYRELDAAVRAFRNGYQAPLLRIVAENISKNYAGGNPVYYSAGQYAAVICSDYPQLWDTSLPPGDERQQQYRAAVNALRDSDPDDFDPFSIDDWIGTGWTEPRTCIGWPTPTDPIPPELPGTDYPDVPTLVLSGDLGLSDVARGWDGLCQPLPQLHLRLGSQRRPRDGLGRSPRMRRRDCAPVHSDRRHGWRHKLRIGVRPGTWSTPIREDVRQPRPRKARQPGRDAESRPPRRRRSPLCHRRCSDPLVGQLQRKRRRVGRRRVQLLRRRAHHLRTPRSSVRARRCRHRRSDVEP